MARLRGNSQNSKEISVKIQHMKDLFLGTIAFLMLATAVVAQSENVAGEQLMLEYYEYSLAIQADHSIPTLRLYDSGRIEIYIPSYKLDAGRYQLQMSPAKQTQLLGHIGDMSHVDSLSLLNQAEATKQATINTDQVRQGSTQSRMTRISIHSNGSDQELVFLNLDQYPAHTRAPQEFLDFKNLVTELRTLSRDEQRQRIGDAVNSRKTRVQTR